MIRGSMADDHAVLGQAYRAPDVAEGVEGIEAKALPVCSQSLQDVVREAIGEAEQKYRNASRQMEHGPEMEANSRRNLPLTTYPVKI